MMEERMEDMEKLLKHRLPPIQVKHNSGGNYSLNI
jgi:hypothetical protein